MLPLLWLTTPPPGLLLLPLLCLPPLLSAPDPLGPLPVLLLLLLPEPKRCCWKGDGPRTLPELLPVLDQPEGALALLLVLAEPKVGCELLL